MSILGSNHTFVPFISGKSVAYEGQRLSQVTFKTVTNPETKAKSKRDSKCVSIPQAAVTSDQTHSMRHHIIAMLENAQDGIIRELVLQNQTSVNDAQIGFTAILEYLDAEAAGTRLNKETVFEWFDAENALGDTLRLVFAEKLGVSETPNAQEVAMIESAVNDHRNAVGSLVGGKTVFSPDMAKQLRLTLEKYCGNDDALSVKFIARLVKMETETRKLMSAI